MDDAEAEAAVNDTYDNDEEEHCIRLKNGLDINKLQIGEPQEFEIYEEDEEYGYEEKDEGLKDGYKYFEEDFLENDVDDATAPSDDKDTLSFDKIANKMVDLIPDGGVKKQTMVIGMGEEIPQDATVAIHYNAYLEYGDEPFDSSYLRRSPTVFSLGSGKVIRGLDIGVGTMLLKEKSRFLIRADYAFGKFGCPPRIPPNATCLYVVELIRVHDKGEVQELLCKSREEQNELPLEEIMKAVNYQRQVGKANFHAKKYNVSCSAYLRAVKLLEDHHLKDEEEETKQQQELLVLYENLACVEGRLNSHPRVITYANKALAIRKTAKAYFTKAKALHALRDFDAALNALKQAHGLQPNNSSIAKEFAELEKSLQKAAEEERVFCRNMFALSATQETAPAATSPAKSDVAPSTSKSSISEEFKEMILEQLTAFRDDNEMSECPFSTNSIALEELGVVEEIAKNLGLFVSPRRLQEKNTHIRVSKNAPEP